MSDPSVPILTAASTALVLIAAGLRIFRKYRWSALALVPLPIVISVLILTPHESSNLAWTLPLLGLTLLAAFRPPLHAVFWCCWASEAFISAVLLFFASFWRLWEF